MSDDALSLGDIVEDLSQILEMVQQREQSGAPASYDAIQAETSGQLHLHILSYIRFLEGQDFLVYDRINDELTVPSGGQQALAAPETWQQDVYEAFAEHIGDDAIDEEDVDELLDGVDDGFLDQIASGIEEVSAELEAEEAAQQAAQQAGFEDSTPQTNEVEPEMAFDGPGPQGSTEQGFTEQGFTEQGFTQDPVDDSAEPDFAPAAEAGSQDATPNSTDAMNGQGLQGQSQGGVTISANPSTAEMYTRQDELGSGGVGTVYRASQTKLARDVALKEINQVFNVFAGVKRDDIIDAFTHVVQQQASLVHPNIVQVIDIETQVEYPFVVTQYAPKGNLRRLIEMEDRPKLSVALKYFMQILAGLKTAHDSGVIHGNLKPENVVLDAAGNAMLSDFGLSSIVEREGGNSAHVYVGVGTVAYMSPEQFQNPNAATIKSDIYSLGIMFYEMLTGKVPGRRSPMPSSFYPDIPRKLDDIFDKMSMDAQEDRYDSTEEILADLYAADEVMSLLDNRSGVLFMTDPIEHGELGGIAVAGGGVGLGEESSSEMGLEESSISEVSEVSEADEDSEAEEVDEAEASEAEEAAEQSEAEDAGDPEAEEADDAEESEADDASDPDDVLDKLDKYGDMFDD
ncbi:serine/threonine protein kinase [Persicimonas caeni]|uniref:Serine/threonine protein kinase n=1 Tax=Persicimonas caeni TaxID=2292766 RepID=A0A4Y6PP77_PERCE|nr:serine/threonine-protein kinase [Persicimonas caeni]QDG50132.1 serine/threonine protein kinase [Persicimonas caeni]QED31353.1 serine/threonine protein kinase [Persicimonas caeni]